MPQGQTRRSRPASSAPRPRIALTIERVVRCAATVSDLLAPDVPAATADLARRAGCAIERAAGRSYRDAVCAELANAALAATAEHLDRQRAALARHLDGPVEIPATDAGLAALARRLGLGELHGDPVAALAAHPAPPAAVLLACMRTARTRDWLLGAGPAPLLREVWESTTDDAGMLAAPGALDLVIAAHTADGIDAERLAWDVIIAETNNHLGLIWHEANKLAPRYPDLDASEVFGFGWQGLRAALRSYDPAVAAFSTYACPRINGAIRDGLRAEQPIPKRLTTLVNKVARAEEALTHSLGRTPELAELSARVGAGMDKMALLPRLTAPASVEELTRHADSDRDAAPSWLADDADPADGALAALRSDAIEEALAQLPGDEADAIRLLLLEGRTPGEAAAVLGTTTRRLRTSKQRGVERLAVLLAAWAPTVAA